MESVDPFDKWLDPPDEPTHDECYMCGALCAVDDMYEYQDDYICESCYNEISSEEDDGNDEAD